MNLSLIQDKIDALGGGGAVVAAFAGGAVVGLVLAGVLMRTGASLAGVADATLAKSMFAAVVSGVVSAIALAGGAVIPGVGTGACVAVGAVGSAIGIKAVYGTTLVKAILVWFCVALVVLAVVLISYAVLGALTTIGGK
jgi:hypothetical protein